MRWPVMMGVPPMIVRLTGVVMMIERAFRAVLMRAGPVDLDLKGRVPDAETGLQFLLCLRQKPVARMSVRHDDMRRQRRLGGAHRPDMR
jgi:hypothetical protein